MLVCGSLLQALFAPFHGFKRPWFELRLRVGFVGGAHLLRWFIAAWGGSSLKPCYCCLQSCLGKVPSSHRVSQTLWGSFSGLFSSPEGREYWRVV